MKILVFLLIIPCCVTENGNPTTEEITELFKNLKDDLEERVTKLEELTKVATLRSCSEYADFGVRTSGLYMIDPDGPLIGQAPFQVFCNFTTGSTEVLHDANMLTSIEHCHDVGCYEKNVTYINGATNEPVPLSQIDALLQLSHHCEQGFSYECTLAPLRVEDVDFAFWTDRNNEKNVYFTGANKGFHSCDCHFSDEGCTEQETRGNRCNCDANLPTPLADTGTITNTTALPVTKLSFGGLTYDIQSGAYQLGNLKCFGKVETKIGSSCSSLKLKGNMVPGYYDIKKPGDQYTSLVFCDMYENGYQNIPQTNQPERSSPLGTIAAWVSKPADDASPEKIPDGWVLCDNSLILDGPWTGSYTPNLNAGHFLSGGELGDQLQFEEDQLQDHRHTDPGHSHSASSSSPSHSHTTTDKYVIIGGDGKYCDIQDQSNCNHGVHAYTRNSNSVSASVTTTVSSHTTGITGVTGSYRKGDETRPKNMRITWIMKCW